jgi:ubiquinone/menaquinone biosynthesis C-methylase UbiE
MSGPADLHRQNAKVLRSWAKQARRYDKSIEFFERRVFGREHRAWACSQASGRTLEVAVGTALNLVHYPQDIVLTGIDLSPEMLAIARARAKELGRETNFREGDAHRLPCSDDSFDTVVCTYSLCNIPDPHQAVSEMARVLRPGGTLILVDHIRSAVQPVLWLQKAIEFFSRRFEGEHLTRRPSTHVATGGFDIVEKEQLAPAGIVERLVAIKRPGDSS